VFGNGGAAGARPRAQLTLPRALTAALEASLTSAPSTMILTLSARSLHGLGEAPRCERGVDEGNDDGRTRHETADRGPCLAGPAAHTTAVSVWPLKGRVTFSLRLGWRDRRHPDRGGSGTAGDQATPATAAVTHTPRLRRTPGRWDDRWWNPAVEDLAA
jgi:hypothetical protein